MPEKTSWTYRPIAHGDNLWPPGQRKREEAADKREIERGSSQGGEGWASTRGQANTNDTNATGDHQGEGQYGMASAKRRYESESQTPSGSMSPLLLDKTDTASSRKKPKRGGRCDTSVNSSRVPTGGSFRRSNADQGSSGISTSRSYGGGYQQEMSGQFTREPTSQSGWSTKRR